MESNVEYQRHKNRHIDQWNKTESPEINPSLYGQLIFDKEERRAKIASSTNGVGRSGQIHAKKMKLDHQLTPHTKFIIVQLQFSALKL